MDPSHARALRSLLDAQPIASLATLHHGEPYASMVPYALLPEGEGVAIHVSQLSPHTRDMLTNPQVSLLVIAPPLPDVPPQATARVTLQGHAQQLTVTDAEFGASKAAYLFRFPDSGITFDLPDFSLFLIRPRSLRFIAGFAQAVTITPAVFAEAIRRG